MMILVYVKLAHLHVSAVMLMDVFHVHLQATFCLIVDAYPNVLQDTMMNMIKIKEFKFVRNVILRVKNVIVMAMTNVFLANHQRIFLLKTNVLHAIAHVLLVLVHLYMTASLVRKTFSDIRTLALPNVRMVYIPKVQILLKLQMQLKLLN